MGTLPHRLAHALDHGARGVVELADYSFDLVTLDEFDVQAAGFIEPKVDVVDFVMRFDDFDDWWAHLKLTSGSVGEADQKMDFATRSDVLAELEKQAAPYTGPDDRLEIPART